MIGTRRVTFYHLYSIEYNPASSLRVFIISHMRITGTAAYIARKNRFISVLEIFEQAVPVPILTRSLAQKCLPFVILVRWRHSLSFFFRNDINIQLRNRILRLILIVYRYIANFHGICSFSTGIRMNRDERKHIAIGQCIFLISNLYGGSAVIYQSSL